ncbi:hypothetical protein CROQUDRAFT_714287 [Cronartium quercuum f. sp. fusiforme G11]|uniref:Long chronological lifespan protein 2 n=1 Tax=Cronartium quercuum f. sp. fusiforme G11 TaxID=708437 RepID=A0A9P6NRJ7_9BASI|nr:hypothetical protein CROQUDRAFT_714287 [Cronartium quercuum f. sp. fusiforme G11]
MIRTFPTCLILLLSLVCLTKSQFGNIFEQFFNQGNEDGSHEHHGHQHHQEQISGGADRWRKMSEQASCSTYLCPSSFECVSRPSECPCLEPEDIKCPIPGSSADEPESFVCTRKPGCTRVQEALRLGSGL